MPKNIFVRSFLILSGITLSLLLIYFSFSKNQFDMTLMYESSNIKEELIKRFEKHHVPYKINKRSHPV